MIKRVVIKFLFPTFDRRRKAAFKFSVFNYFQQYLIGIRNFIFKLGMQNKQIK